MKLTWTVCRCRSVCESEVGNVNGCSHIFASSPAPFVAGLCFRHTPVPRASYCVPGTSQCVTSLSVPITSHCIVSSPRLCNSCFLIVVSQPTSFIIDPCYCCSHARRPRFLSYNSRPQNHHRDQQRQERTWPEHYWRQRHSAGLCGFAFLCLSNGLSYLVLISEFAHCFFQ